MERLRVPQKTIGIAIASGIGSLAMIACGGGDRDSKVQNGATLTPPAATETLKPLPTPTLEITVAPTQTPEVKQEAPCVVLPQEYCSQGKLVEWKDESTGIVVPLAVFDLPKGIPIRAPFSGQLGGTLNGQNPLNPEAPLLSIIDSNSPNVPAFDIGGAFAFADNINIDYDNVIEGAIIAYTQDTGLRVLEGSIAISLSSQNPETGVRDYFSPLREAFPYLFNQ